MLNIIITFIFFAIFLPAAYWLNRWLGYEPYTYPSRSLCRLECWHDTWENYVYLGADIAQRRADDETIKFDEYYEWSWYTPEEIVKHKPYLGGFLADSQS